MGLFQAQAMNAGFVRLEATDDALGERHGDGFLGSHVLPLFSLSKNFFDGFAAFGSNFRRTANLGQTIERGANHVIWIG